MKNKTVLSENFFIKGFISPSQQLDKFYIKNNIIKNFAYGEFQTKNKLDPRKHYVNLTDDINVKWSDDYLRDHYELYHNRTLEIQKWSGIYLNSGSSISLHNHIFPHDLINSPEVSGIYVLECGKEPIEVCFEYEDTLLKKNKKLVSLKTNDYIIFNSNLNHEILKNRNENPLLLVSYRWQYQRS